MFSLTTFSPSGKLVQIEVGIVRADGAKNGVVIATEKKLPTCLIDESTVQKIVLLTESIGVVYSGMGPDFRVLIAKGRKAAQAYYRVYRETIPVTQLVRELASVMQEYSRAACGRSASRCCSRASTTTGRSCTRSTRRGRTSRGRRRRSGSTWSTPRPSSRSGNETNSVHTALLTLKEGFEGAMDHTNIEVGIVGADGAFKVLTPAEIKDYLEEVE